MKVLSVASECAPFVKTGGLADVVGALPAALAGQGIDMRLILPAYAQARGLPADGQAVHRQADLYGGRVTVRRARAEGIDMYLVEAPHLYDRDGTIYLGPGGRDWPDNPERFVALCRMAVALCEGADVDWRPDILHAHDWQGGFAPHLARKAQAPVGSVMTIHNVAFSGTFDADRIEPLGLDPADFRVEGFEFWGGVSALKAGLVGADRITTVSPTYARELTTPHFGMGFDGLLSARADVLTGILNGVDLDAWDPAADPDAPNFDTPAGKPAATAALRADFDLPDSDGPLAVVVSRLTTQKGLDLLPDALPDFLQAGGQLALLGSGDADLERQWRQLGAAHAGVGVRIGYDEVQAHRLIAGGEAVLVPSRFEPCGLTQLYGLRYGTIPVVARTGGLADTVIDANDAALKAGVATGIVHAPDDTADLAFALSRLVTLRGQRQIWAQLQANAMSHPVGWEVQAAQYADLYRSLGPST